MTAKLRIATAADVAETVPMLLGYQPTERVAVLCLAGRRVSCTLAVEVTVSVEDIRESVRSVIDTAGVTQAIVVVYSDHAERHVIAAALREELAGFVGVLDSIVVTRHTITSLVTGDCEARSMTPSAAQVQAVVAGLSQPAATRDQLAARYMSNPEHVAQRQQLHKVATSSLSLETLNALKQPMSAQIAARLGGALTEDELTQQWVTMPMGVAHEALSLWAQVATYYSDSEPAPEADRILSLCGLCAFLAGNGVALVAVLDRFHARTRAGVMDPRIDPTRRLLDAFGRGSVSPSSFAAARERITDDLI